MSTTLGLLDVEHAAAYLDVSPHFIRRLVREKRVRYYKLGGTFVRFTKEDLDAFALGDPFEAKRR